MHKLMVTNHIKNNNKIIKLVVCINLLRKKNITKYKLSCLREERYSFGIKSQLKSFLKNFILFMWGS